MKNTVTCTQHSEGELNEKEKLEILSAEIRKMHPDLRATENMSPSILELGYAQVSGVYSNGWNKTIKVFNSYNLKNK